MRGRRGFGAAAVLALAAIVVLLAACASTPLVAGEARIWDVQGGRFIDRDELIARVAPARYRLLGEVHDNPAHHALRAQVIDDIVRSGRHPAIVMEQMDLGREGAVHAAQAAGGDADAIAAAGGLDRSAWRWPLHKPILVAAVAGNLSVYPGNVPRQALTSVVRTGDVATVDPAWDVRLSRSAWTATKADTLAHEIEDSHCGKLPAAMVPRLALAQRVRDAAMAEALVRHATADGVILIAGNGHVRGDLGVPAYLDPGSPVVSVGWIERPAEAPLTAEAMREAAKDHPGFDYLWPTAAVAREDPCRAMEAPRPQASLNAAAGRPSS